jgi:aspartyl protease family protein
MKPLRFTTLCLLVVIAYCVHAQETENPDDLLAQLESLQSRMNIQITGLEKIGDEPKIRTRGNLEQQLRQTLADYNHIISQNTKGQIERVVIVNKKDKTESERIVLPTRQQDGHAVVSVDISGNGTLWQTLDMIIDTGADLIVLPKSMIEGLGLADYKFGLRKMQTANGSVFAKIAKLQQVKLAGETLENVDVAFLDDKLLANNRLLGMSALGRFKMVIDDQSQLITLFKK